MSNDLIEKALIIVTKAHKGQKDKSGAPYIFHPIRVFYTKRMKKELLHCFTMS